MSFVEDRSVFFNTDEFADTALYNGVVSVDGILDDEFADVFQGEQVGVSSNRPVFYYNADDIASPLTDVALVVNGTTYTVRDIEVDRDIGKLILEAV